LPPRQPPLELIESGWRPFLDAFVERGNLLFRWVPGLTLTSWFRSPEENLAVGGDPESQHLVGLAADLAGSQDALRRAHWIARELGFTVDPEPGHLHVQAFPKGALARAGISFPAISS